MIDNGRLDLTFHMDQNTRACKWNHRLCCPLCSISFSEHVLRVHRVVPKLDSSLWLSDIPLHGCASLCSSSHLSMDTWATRANSEVVNMGAKVVHLEEVEIEEQP